ncbi:hypothetical protein ABBQ32_010085 [Trebouxia sp. C0010 RCD-2024]
MTAQDDKSLVFLCEQKSASSEIWIEQRLSACSMCKQLESIVKQQLLQQFKSGDDVQVENEEILWELLNRIKSCAWKCLKPQHKASVLLRANTVSKALSTAPAQSKWLT